MKKLLFWAGIASVLAACSKDDQNSGNSNPSSQEENSQQEAQVFPSQTKSWTDNEANATKKTITINEGRITSITSVVLQNNNEYPISKQTTTLSYDTGKNLPKEITTKIAFTGAQIRKLTLEQNSQGQLTSIREEAGQTTTASFEYQNQKLYKSINANGTVLTYTYPSANTVVATRTDGDITDTYTYIIEQGNITKIVFEKKIRQQVTATEISEYTYDTAVKNPTQGLLFQLLNADNLTYDETPYVPAFYSKKQMKTTKITRTEGTHQEITEFTYNITQKNDKGYPTQIAITQKNTIGQNVSTIHSYESFGY